MTAEIAILNREAVALAADSAVTVGFGKKRKIFSSAIKLFCLSKYEPIGIMIYGDATLMGMPWETIIKLYRQELGKSRFENLEKYSEDFIAFIGKSTSFFPADQQKAYAMASIFAHFQEISGIIDVHYKEKQKKRSEISIEEVYELVIDDLNKYKAEIDKLKFITGFDQNSINSINDLYGSDINKLKRKVFEKLIDNQKISDLLSQIATALIAKVTFKLGSSGLVIAGFGRKDIYPSLVSFTLGGVISDKLRYNIDNNFKIGQNGAAIFPFAQGDMISGFMEGIGPKYKRAIVECIFKIFEEYPKLIADNISSINKESLTKLKEVGNQVLPRFLDILQKQEGEYFVEPVIDVVSHLPKDELAIMAETLVNLTSFKKRVSTQEESVGGPIDVAVISKGDGFIWIKRKHYFNKDLNVRFLSNYFREE